MAISFIGEAHAAATTVTIPTHAIGDLLIIVAYRTAVTAPGLGAAFQTLVQTTGNVNAFRVGYKVATATNDASGTWTNATFTQAFVYRNATFGSIVATNSATGTTIVTPALNLSFFKGNSWVLGWMGSKAASISTPAGRTLRGTATGTSAIGIGFDTNAGVTSYAGDTGTNGSSTVHAQFSLELVEAQNPPAAPTLSTPANAGTTASLTPTLNFSGTDPQSDSINYEVEIDTTSTFTSNSQAAPVVVQRKAGLDSGGGTGSIALAFTSNVTAGNSIIVCVPVANTNNSVITTPTDTRGNTYNMIADITDGTNFVGQRWFLANNTSAGANTVTINDANTTTNMHIWEVSGPVVYINYDVSAFAVQSSATALNSGNTAATAVPNSLILSVACDDVTGVAYVAGAGYSNLTTQSNSAFSSASQEKTVSATGAQSATMTIVSASTVSCISCFAFSVSAAAIDSHSVADAGYTDITAGGSSPFASGDSINYVVQTSLTNSTTYFWRTRGVDPTGSATHGAWPSAFSFTVNTTPATGITFITYRPAWRL